MCWVCDSKSSIAEGFWANKLGLSAHFANAADKDATAFPADGVGDLKTITPGALIVVTTDDVPDDTSTTRTIEVNGEHIVSTIDTIGDQDFFRVELQAGETYEIGQYAKVGGPGGAPLSDAYIEIYDSAGDLIVSADGGGPNTPSGLDALLSFTPDADGTYFINARAYDQSPEDGSTTGEAVGDYELFVDLAPAGTYVYTPYYDVDSPLYALDWGTQVDGSSRNPDGEEGPRPTGNDFTGAAYNPYGIEGKTVITYYFAKQGDVFVSEDPANPGLENTVAAGMRDFEIAAFESAMGEFEEVADVVYVEVQDRNEADFIYITYDGTPNVGVLGRMSPPDTQNEGQAEFNRNGPGWNAQNLVKGGFSWVTLTHELGHGMGMAHPHDNGGRSGIMHGVEPEGTAFDYTTGDFALNQGIFTMMSYEDGWQSSPYGNAPTQSGYGYNGSLAAFDIAVIQDKYGVNEDTATGDNIYRMKDVNASGTYFESIWDAAGIDQMVYTGARDATVDLRPATLQYEEGGGGRVSYAFGIFGGFTIANGVTIENARTGSGDDMLFGNDVANRLDGGAGVDRFEGGRGDDWYYVDNAGDTVIERLNEGNDRVFASNDFTLAAGSNVETLSTTANLGIGGIDLTGNEFDNRLIGNAGNNKLDGKGGIDQMSGFAGSDSYYVDNVGDTVTERQGEGNDRVFASLDYTLATGLYVETLSTAYNQGTTDINLNANELANELIGNFGENVLKGLGGNDKLSGLNGDDSLHGGAGRDKLTGGLGNDGFFFDNALGSANVDEILDFTSADDSIHLNRAVFTQVGLGTLSASAFRAGTSALDADDRIIYDQASGELFYDADGNGAAAAVLFATVNAGTTLNNSDIIGY